MAQRKANISIFLLAGLFVAMLPPIELSHSHAGGLLPHRHERGGEANGHVTDRSREHRHDAPDDHTHAHPHEHYRYDLTSHSHEHAADIAESTEPLEQDAAHPGDRHSHFYWFGVSFDSGISTTSETESAGYDSFAQSWVSCCSSLDSTSLNHFLRSATIRIHGPPAKFLTRCPTSIARLQVRPLTSPPLCDAARHERTGVLLV